MKVESAKVVIPAMADAGAQLLAAAFGRIGMEAEVTPPSDAHTLELGARYTSGDECFPARVTIGDFNKVLERPDTDPAKTVLLMPSADGPCRFGQYAHQLRRVLDALRYGSVRILSPNCDDSYASLGRLAAPFFRTAWRTATAADLLDKLLLMTRPYEIRNGEAEQVYRQSIGVLQHVVETAPLCPGPQIRALRDALTGCRRQFARIALRTESRPLIGVVGEIFCRLNSFANQNVIRRLEEYGAEVWIAGFIEWIWYTNAEEMRLLRLHGKSLTRRAWAARIRNHFQRIDERTLRRALPAEVAWRPDPHIGEVLDAARRYLPVEGATGEMVLNVGNVSCFAQRGADGVVDISPFTCMNGIVSEAIYPRVSRDLGGFKVRCLHFDGASADSHLELELGVFMEMARAYHGKNRTSQPGSRVPQWRSPAPEAHETGARGEEWA